MRSINFNRHTFKASYRISCWPIVSIKLGVDRRMNKSPRVKSDHRLSVLGVTSAFQKIAWFMKDFWFPAWAATSIAVIFNCFKANKLRSRKANLLKFLCRFHESRADTSKHPPDGNKWRRSQRFWSEIKFWFCSLEKPQNYTLRDNWLSSWGSLECARNECWQAVAVKIESEKTNSI